MVLVGTEDRIPKFMDVGQGTDPRLRLQAFEELEGGERILGVIDGAHHCDFSNGAGSMLMGDPKPQKHVTDAIEEVTTEFWVAHLMGRQDIQSILTSDSPPFPPKIRPGTFVTWRVKH